MRIVVLAMAVCLVLGASAFAGEKGETPRETNMCIAAGPQSPRDLDMKEGLNGVLFSLAPDIGEMNLCNIHFHRNAEHKAAAFSTFVEDGDNSGWACKAPTAERLADDHVSYNGCNGIAPGDTIEVHWVHTTCDITSTGVKPLGAGLNACLTTMCPNPELKVAAQVFTLQKGGKLRFSTSPVSPEAPSVVYAGSTTGTSFSNEHCSPLQVTWDVKTTCESLDIDDFSKWCADNQYDDHHAHGVRELVTSKELLSEIR